MRNISHPFRSGFSSLALLACLGAALMPFSPVRGQSAGHGFTYQGRLTSGGVPASGLYDMRFRLYDSPGFGAQFGSTVCLDNVSVQDGLFTVALDFGAQFLMPEARYLEIEIRSDTGLTCANTSGYTVLSMRQRMTPTPLATHAYSAYSLTAADGSPTNAVYVDNAGNVGVGTTSPARKLTVAGDMEMGLNDGWYHHFRIGGGNSSGYIYGSFPAYADGIHMGYNYYADAGGVHRIRRPDGQTSRITTGYGFIALATGGTNMVPANRVFVNTAGNVGIGTDAPAARLDVAGQARVRTLQIVGGSDLAEPFDVAECADVTVLPGMLVVIDPAKPGNLKVATDAYDTRVAGAISGANGLAPGMVMRAEGEAHADGQYPVAIAGRVWVWCDAAFGAIVPGDRLTTSTVPGHAMRVADEARAGGAVVGKAMTELKEGRGMVLVLINLQ
jgi:hypothetical protein